MGENKGSGKNDSKNDSKNNSKSRNTLGHYHGGHRQRLKNRYLAEGLDSFEDHQLLELLLFYAIPYRDTNNLAYDLLKEFGSVAAVLEAEPHQLMKVKGIGNNAASLLSLMPQVCRRYQRDKWGKKPLLDTTSALGEFAVTLFIGHTNEVFYLICLDAQNRLNHAALTQMGTINEVAVYPRSVVETALRHKAKSVVLAHNHPGGSLRPTTADMDLTWCLTDAMKHINIPVIDHIIVAGGRYISFVEKGLLCK